MRTKFLFPDWDEEDNDDECDEPQSLCDQMLEMEKEKERRERQGLPEKKEPEPPSPTAKSPRKRANFFSDLVEQIAKSKVLLFTEDGEPFAYDEELGCYQPIPQLTAWLANFFPEITTRSLLANDLREIAQRLTWREDLRCCRDEFNRSKELVNLENGVFNLESGELLEHDPRFRFTYQVKASYLQDPEYINCPTFEAFCRSSLDGDTQKRQLLLEIIGYICSDLTVGKCAFFLQGQPNSGKSIVAEFTGQMFDPSLVSNVPLHQLGDRFSRAELAGKKVNIAGEIAGRALRDISLFKSPALIGSWGNSRDETLSTFPPDASCCLQATRCRGRLRRTPQLPSQIGSWSYSSIRASRRRNRTRACWAGFAKRRTPL